MFYRSTRSDHADQTFRDVTLKGLAPDGGLFVPVHVPVRTDWADMIGLDYATLAARVMHPFVGECIEYDDLLDMTRRAYGDRFRSQAVVPVHSLSPKDHVLELFHGPTLAFKDLALQMLGGFFDYFLDGTGRQLTILGATSGDTGSAAIEAVRGRENLKIVMLHPKGRVSDVQRRQMTTVFDQNVLNIAVEGSFDDCQALVKASFGERAFADKVSLGAVNSINWARVLAQVVYYAHACLTLELPKTGVSFSVPTGNFGDIYAGYLARQMGLPIRDLVIATNANDILVRAHESGVYERRQSLGTLSPSMDIQIASNFERFLSHHLSAAELAVAMTAFQDSGHLGLGAAHAPFVAEFEAARVDDRETIKTISEVHAAYGYDLDPHSAIGYRAAHRVEARGHRVTLATAHPAKFPSAMAEALGAERAQNACTLPQHMAHLMTAQERFETLPPHLDSLMARVEEFAL